MSNQNEYENVSTMFNIISPLKNEFLIPNIKKKLFSLKKENIEKYNEFDTLLNSILGINNIKKLNKENFKKLEDIILILNNDENCYSNKRKDIISNMMDECDIFDEIINLFDFLFGKDEYNLLTIFNYDSNETGIISNNPDYDNGEFCEEQISKLAFLLSQDKGNK